MQNHFELFGLAPAFALEPEALERSYHDIQSRVHPDRFAHAGEAERRASLQWTTRVNEAYRALKDPVQRARHLLELHGIDVKLETSTQMPGDFLLQQLELREQLERGIKAKDAGVLDALRKDLAVDKTRIEARLADDLDRKHDYEAATELVRKLMFLDRLDGEIDAAYDAVEA